ncbi:MAG: family 43 glycosylhydrolase [Bacteroidales bacterium]|jgi:beta-xylosidase
MSLNNKIRYFCLILILFPCLLAGQRLIFINPILSGSHHDASICRSREDYYIVNLSFKFFPGLPIHHCRDLINWELIILYHGYNGAYLGIFETINGRP